MSKLDALLIDARGAIAKNSRPSFSAADYDDGCLELAKREKRAGETEAQALDRLVYVEKNADVCALYSAAIRARTFAPSPPTIEQLAKRSPALDAVLEYVREQSKPGEDEAAAITRLSRAGDPELRQLYAKAVA